MINLGLILALLRKFLNAKSSKRLTLKNDVSSSKTAGNGQIDKIINKNNSTINMIDNSVHNENYTIIMPTNFQNAGDSYGEFKDIIHEAFNQHDVQVILSKPDKTLSAYEKFEAQSNSKKIADFFVDKIPKMDLQLLRTGLYIKYLLDNNNKKKALEIKEGAARSSRARNIINLASAGYFESYIKPIYENDESVFKNEYEEVVTYMPEIIFVNGNMSTSKLLEKIDEKISRSEQYHIQVKCITINGLYKTVDIIREVEPIVRKKYSSYKVNLKIEGSDESFIRGKMRIKFPVVK